MRKNTGKSCLLLIATMAFLNWGGNAWALNCTGCVVPFCVWKTNAGDLQVGKRYMLKSQCEPRECGADDESECTAKVELTKAKSYELSGDLSDPADVFGLSGTWKTDETLLSSCEEKVKCKPNTTRPAGYAYLVYNYVQKSQRWTSVGRPGFNGACDPCADNTKVGVLCKDPFTSCGGILHSDWEPALKTVADVCGP